MNGGVGVLTAPEQITITTGDHPSNLSCNAQPFTSQLYFGTKTYPDPDDKRLPEEALLGFTFVDYPCLEGTELTAVKEAREKLADEYYKLGELERKTFVEMSPSDLEECVDIMCPPAVRARAGSSVAVAPASRVHWSAYMKDRGFEFTVDEDGEKKTFVLVSFNFGRAIVDDAAFYFEKKGLSEANWQLCLRVTLRLPDHMKDGEQRKINTAQVHGELPLYKHNLGFQITNNTVPDYWIRSTESGDLIFKFLKFDSRNVTAFRNPTEQTLSWKDSQELYPKGWRFLNSFIATEDEELMRDFNPSRSRSAAGQSRTTSAVTTELNRCREDLAETKRLLQTATMEAQRLKAQLEDAFLATDE
jgi:hypothetical protein